jgi:hypothetical protein
MIEVLVLGRMRVFDVDDDSEALGEAHLGISLLKSLQEREPTRRCIVWLSR